MNLFTRSLVLVMCCAWLFSGCGATKETQAAGGDDAEAGDVGVDADAGPIETAAGDVADIAGTDAVSADADTAPPEDTQAPPKDVTETGADAVADVADVTAVDASSSDSVDDALADDAVANDMLADDADSATEPDNGNPPCGALVGCADGSPCTDDSCVNGVCLHVDNTATCSDGDNCTDETCVGGKCTLTGAVNCDDGNACTLDACTQADGCTNLPQSATPCDDANASTTLDTCVTGTCMGLDVIVVPAGNFFMGCSPLDPDCANNESPGHLVELSAYAMDRKEVTVAQYKACKDAGGCNFLQTGPGCTGTNVTANAALPLSCVTYTSAVAYCTWLGGRLPTEAEWEKAARGGCEKYPAGQCETQATVYPWGNAPMTCELANGKDGATPSTCPGVPTLPGSLAGNSPYGFSDLGGNVEEWVSDEYDETYYAQTPVGGWVNPKGATTGTGVYGLRGGSWAWSAALMRNSYRDFTDVNGSKYTGFRCAFDVP